MDRPFSSPARGVMGWSFWGHSKRPGQCQQDIKVSRPATGHLSLLVSFGGPSTPSTPAPRRSTEPPLHRPPAGAEGPPWRRRCSWTSPGSPPGRSPAATLPHRPGQSPRPRASGGPRSPPGGAGPAVPTSSPPHRAAVSNRMRHGLWPPLPPACRLHTHPSPRAPSHTVPARPPHSPLSSGRVHVEDATLEAQRGGSRACVTQPARGRVSTGVPPVPSPLPWADAPPAISSPTGLLCTSWQPPGGPLGLPDWGPHGAGG